METLKSLYAKRATVHSQMKDVAKKWEAQIAANQEIDKDEERQWDAWDGDYKNITEQIERMKKLESIQADVQGDGEKPIDNKRKDQRAEYSEAFEKYMRSGIRSLSNDQVDMLEKNLSTEARAATASSTTVADGGYTIPEDFSNILEKFMAWYGPFAGVGMNAPYYQLNSTSGADLPWPTVNDTANAGYLIAESGDITTSSTGFTFGVETLKAYAYTSGLVPVTRQIIQDSGLPFVEIVLGLLAERLGRAKNTACTTGTGDAQPEGVTIGGSQGKWSASATAFTPAEILDLVYSVDPAYRMSPKAGFMMHPNIVSAIRKLDTSTSNYTQPLWQPSFAAGAPDRILGYQYWENAAMASAQATGAKVMLFGDFNKFVIRNVKQVEVIRSEERYVEFLQIAFLGWMRFDSRVINSSAIKWLENT